jgi:hypothetical protein
MEVRIGDRALSQLVHLISAKCMPWIRSDFVAPELYSCNWFTFVSQRARHVFAKHMPMHPLVNRCFKCPWRVSFLHILSHVSATCMPWFRNDFAPPDLHSCNWFTFVSQRARHTFTRYLPECFSVKALLEQLESRVSYARGTARLNGTIGKVKWTL